MIELHTLGDSLITVNGKEVRPSSPMVFAALLYLGVERGRRIARASLQELLFPGTGEKGSHSLRQLLYKLRKLGVPLQSDTTTTLLPAAAVQPVPVGRPELGILPDYSGDLSPQLREWVESYRGKLAAELRTRLLADLSAARLAGDAQRTLSAATNLLAVDPLNEEGVLGRAEALALAGQKAEALRSLDEYARDVGSLSPDLRIPANILRKRIVERTSPVRTDYPLLGRSKELDELLQLAREAAAGRVVLAVVLGDAGMGKTRLLHELRAHLSLKPTLTVLARCRPHDGSRPMGPLLDVLPALLQARGALGVSEESHAVLRALLGTASHAVDTQPSDWAATRLHGALEDLLSSVSAESTIALLIEDAHWLDQASLAFLEALSGFQCRMLIVLTCRSASAPPSILSRASVVRRLDPLGTSDAGALLRLAIGSELELHPGLVERCVALGAGNALFLRTIGEHFRRKGAEPSSEATLHDLLLQRCNSLSPTALLVLRSVVALGIHGTQDRLDRCLALSHGALLLALQELCDRGLVVHSEDGIQCAHDLLADLVTSETPKALLVGICSRVAAVLEEDGALSRQPALLWACAECWTLASSRSRAAAALRKCAGVAMNVGQPRFAIEALEKAQGYVSDEELGSCIEDTIRIADDAWDPQAVFRNLERIRTWRRSQGRDPLGSTIAEIAALNGARRAEVPIWEHRELMHRCVNNPEASVLDRLRAARVFHLVAEEHLDREAADSLHASVTEGLSIDPTSSAGLHYLVTYHGTFGTLTEGAAIAHDLVARHTTGDQPPISAVTYSAVVLFRHGHVDEACRLCKRFLALAQKAKLAHHTIALYAAQLAAMLIQEGDQDQAEHFNSLALENIASSGRSHNGATLSNLIDLAIARGRFEQAGEMQAQLRSEYSTMFTPNRERVALGNDLLIAVKRGRLPMTDQVTAAEQLFAIGATLSDADALALGLMATYHAQGDRLRARAFGSHYLESLRRDNYRLTPVFRDCFGSLQ